MMKKRVTVEETAEHWLQHLQSSDCTPIDREYFMNWCEQDSAHSDAFARAQRLDAQLSAIAERTAITDLRQKIWQSTANKSTLFTSFHLLQLLQYLPLKLLNCKTLLRPTLCIAAPIAAFTLIYIFLLPLLTVSIIHYETAVGQQNTITLNDGTEMTLDTATHVQVVYNTQQRSVILTQGQAFFNVAHQPDRPFIVHAGNKRVRAIGTAFSIKNTDNLFAVTLAKGKINVFTTPSDTNDSLPTQVLSPGEQLSYSTEHGVQRTKVDDIKTSISWTTGKLIFQSSKLGDVVSEVSRYTQNTIILNDGALYNIEINGVFHAGDIQTFLLILENTLDITTVHKANGDIELSMKH